MILKKWKFSGAIFIVLAVACLVTMLMLNQTHDPKSGGLPWLGGFFICLIAAPYCWWKGDQEGE